MAAIKSQSALLRVSTATVTADTITGITAASPGVVSAASHGMTAGAIAVLAGIVGMTQLNDRAFVVGSPASGTFELKGVDTSGYTAYGSAGTATEQTMSEIGQVTTVEGFDGQAQPIDTTHLRSTAKEFLMGLQDFGTVKLNLNLSAGDTGQAKLRALKRDAAIGTFSLTLSDGSIAAFRGYVQSFTFGNVQPDGVVNGSVQILVSGEPSWFA